MAVENSSENGYNNMKASCDNVSSPRDDADIYTESFQNIKVSSKRIDGISFLLIFSIINCKFAN